MSNETAFVDTNLLLHYLTNDIPERADAVERLLRQAIQGEITAAQLLHRGTSPFWPFPQLL
jgi:predicted nucleic acid-binding protein